MSEEEGVSRRQVLRDSTIVASVAVAAAAAAGAAAVAQTPPGSRQDPVYPSWVEKKGQVATIRVGAGGGTGAANADGGDAQAVMGEVFSKLRGDDSVRVIVLTGRQDHVFGVPPYGEAAAGAQDATQGVSQRGDAALWRGSTGIIRTHEEMAAIEKPIVARVNGDAVGYFANLMWACDLIVAREDAVIAEHHLAPVTVPSAPAPMVFNTIPGDGGVAWLPLHMSPAKAKECLMLGKTHTGKELAQMGVINYAVKASELDHVTDDIVQRLLQRSAFALAWTKRVISAHYKDRLNATLSPAMAYELVGILQMGMSKGKIPTTLV